jgi:hypothetical protein
MRKSALAAEEQRFESLWLSFQMCVAWCLHQGSSDEGAMKTAFFAAMRARDQDYSPAAVLYH